MGIVVLSGMLDRDSKWHAGNGRSEGPARICRPGSRFEFETAVLEGGLGMALAGLSSGRLRQMPRWCAFSGLPFGETRLGAHLCTPTTDPDRLN